MSRIAAFVSFVLLCLSIPSFAQVGLFADIALSKDIFYPPDHVEIWVRGANFDLERPVDIYLTVRTPDGRELYAPTFTEMGCPWIHNIVLPQGFRMDWTRFYAFTLPSAGFPLATPGQYVISLWLCAAGTQDRLTVGSSQRFTIAPCDRKSWVNDNQVWSLELDVDGVWAGLMHGVEFFPYDNPIRMMRKGEDGVNSFRTYLFRGFDGNLSVGGMDIGLSVKYPYGWRRILNSPGTFAYSYGVHAAVTDRDGTLWLCHKWPTYMSNEGDLIGCWPNGFIEDHTQDVGGMARYVVLTNEGKACAIGKDGLYVHQGDGFDFHEIDQLATTGTVLLNCAQGDVHGNVWMMAFVNHMPYLYKYELGTREMTVYKYGDPAIGDTTIDVITSDPMGNVWFAQRGSGLLMWDGTNFTAFPLGQTLVNCLAVGFDNTIYCGTETTGIQVLKDGIWTSYKNPSPEINNYYSFLVGLPDGGALAAYQWPGLGFAMLEEGVWRRVAADGSIPVAVYGVFPGQTGLWAWERGGPHVYRQTDAGWVDASERCDLDPNAYCVCLLEADDGTPYLLMSNELLTFTDGTWSTIDTPPPAGFGYKGMWIDHNGKFYLCDYGGVIQARDLDGVWTRIDDTNQLPAKPQAMTVSESGLLYVLCQDEEAGTYLTVIDDGQATSHPLDGLGNTSQALLTSDLADRAWIIAQAPDLSGLVIVFDPASEALGRIPWQSGLLPFKDLRNYAMTSGGADRSMQQLGTLWLAGTPARLNLAPRTELLLDKAAYSYGEAMRVDAYFANQAGSIPVDWYAAVADAHGNLFYWPTYTQAKTPAFHGLLVPTDTALILHLDDITIPDGIAPGHNKWKTGFTRAGQETWLGLGFTATGEFDVVAH